MKKSVQILMLFIAIIILSYSQTQAETKKKPLVGEWIYEVSDAPYGYEKGSLIFSEKDGQTVCVIKLDAGELQVSELKVDKNKISFSTMIEGNVIHVDLVRDKNKITGTVDSPEGPKTLTAARK